MIRKPTSEGITYAGIIRLILAFRRMCFGLMVWINQYDMLLFKIRFLYLCSSQHEAFHAKGQTSQSSNEHRRLFCNVFPHFPKFCAAAARKVINISIPWMYFDQLSVFGSTSRYRYVCLKILYGSKLQDSGWRSIG